MSDFMTSSISEQSIKIYQTLNDNPILRFKTDRYHTLPVSNLSLTEIFQITLIIDKYKTKCIQRAQTLPEQTVFFKAKHYPSLPRTIQFCADGSILFYLNNEIDNDFVEEGGFNKAFAAIKVDSLIRILMVTAGKLHGRYEHFHAERSRAAAEQLKGQEGIVDYFGSYVLNNKDVQQNFSFWEFCNRSDLVCFQEYNYYKGVSTESFWNECKIVLDLLRGWKSLCDKGIVHRDIKLENIFVKESEGVVSARIGDFGCAVPKGFVDDIRVGTPMYYAPEICRDNHSYSHASDAWAIGICIAKLVNQYIPWDVDDIAEVVKAISNLRTCPFPAPRGKVESMFFYHLVWDLCQIDPEMRITVEEAIRKYEFIIMSGDLITLKRSMLEEFVRSCPKEFNAVNKFFHKLVTAAPISFNFRNKPVTFEEFKSILQKYKNIESIVLPEDATDDYLMLIKEHCSQLKRLNCINIQS